MNYSASRPLWRSRLLLAGLLSLAFAPVNGCAQQQEDTESSTAEITAQDDTRIAAVAQTSARLNATAQATSRSAESKLQTGPWVPTTWNYEEPFINIIHASEVAWTAGGMDTQALYDAGHINPDTGLPVSMPKGATTMGSNVYFTARDKSYYKGDWVLEWEGDADLEMLYIPRGLQWRATENRLEFTRDGSVIDHAAILIRRLGPGGITALRLYRAENEALLREGKIYNPRFLEMISRSHIIRTMDLQEANRTAIRSLDGLATMDAAFWNNKAWQSVNNVQHKRRSMPLAAVFALGVEADTELWTHAPITLGVPVDFHAPEIGGNQNKFGNMAKDNAHSILASEAWDDYADAFVAALISSGYPSDRMLYSTLDNEVWNYAGHYLVSIQYASGVGKAVTGEDYAFRPGYGVLMARWAMALEGALTRAGREQKVTYAVEGQAAGPWTSLVALTHMRNQVEKSGGDWAALAPRIGVSVASYWGKYGFYEIFPDVRPKSDWPYTDAEKQALRDKWEAEVRRDPDGLSRKLADYIINGPKQSLQTKAWIVEKFMEHQAIANNFGVAFIGAYEGGSHDEQPLFFGKSYGTNTRRLNEWYEDYHWGPEGARVNTAVNDALVEAFPGIILSNYGTVGDTGGQPWFDGLYDDNNPMQQSWARYERDR